MTDRELTKLAARAAYTKLIFDSQINQFRNCTMARPESNLFAMPIWNPLIDDGDALRLAVKLNIDVMQDKHEQVVSARCPGIDFDDDWIGEHWGNDKLAATRRAIVRAAASIGGAT